jgi:hypothetical protein
LLTAIGIGAVVTMSVSAWQVVGSRSRVAASTSAPSALAEPPAVAAPTTSMSPSTPAPEVVKTPSPSPLLEPTTPTISLKGIAPAARYGIVVGDLESGEEVFSELPDESFEAASVVKLLIALDALDHGASADLVTRMLFRSDDDIANQLWRSGLVSRWVHKIGLTGTVPPADPNRWGDTLVSPRDVVRIHSYIEGSRNGKTIMSALSRASAEAADGFDQTFGVPDAVGDLSWAVKQGWSCCNDGRRVLNTTGTVNGHYVVAVLTGHPSQTSYATAAARVTELVAALLPAISER